MEPITLIIKLTGVDPATEDEALETLADVTERVARKLRTESVLHGYSDQQSTAHFEVLNCEYAPPKAIDRSEGSDRIPWAMNNIKDFSIEIKSDKVVAHGHCGSAGVDTSVEAPTVGEAIDKLDKRISDIAWNN